MSIILETRKLCKSYGHFAANTDIDFAVEEGELRAVIGPNGAGKTTFFNVIAGTIAATSGDKLFRGTSIVGQPGAHRVQMGIAKAFQTANIYPDQSVFQNCRLAALAKVQGEFALQLFAQSTRLQTVDDYAHAALAAVELTGVDLVRAGDLSHGDKKRLDIAMALATQPSLLLLDEPVAGMSLEDSQKTGRLIRKLAGGMTVLLIEHDMGMVMNISDRITVLHQGRVLAEGTPSEIRNNSAVREAYLGGHTEQEVS